MKLVIQLVLLALAFLGGMALERRSEMTKAVEHHVSSVAPAPGLSLERDTDAQDTDSNQHVPVQEAQAKPTLAHLLTLSEERNKHRALDKVPPSELAAMLDDLRESNDQSPEARALKRVLYNRWANEQPLAALKHAQAHEKNPRLKEQVIHQAFARLTERGEVNAALEAFGKLETRRQKEEAISAMAHRTNLEGLPFLADFFMNDTPNVPVEALFRVWAERDPGGAGILDLAAAGGSRAVHAALEGMAMSDPEAAFRMAQEFDPKAMPAALRALSHVDPTLAAAELETLPLGRQRSELAREIAHRMAQDDIGAALAWTETLDPAAKREALQEVSQEWARHDPQSAAEHALTLSDPHQQRDAVSEATLHWDCHEPSAALEWANNLEGDTGLAAIRGVIGTIADNDPQAAASMIDQLDFSAAPGDAYSDMAGDLAGQWSRFDPESAANWAQTLPAKNDAQHHAFERVADHWVEQDTLGASEWVGGLPEGELRDIAARRLVEHITPSDPDAAYQWALSMSDPGDQTEMLHQVFEQWQERDPQSAEATWNAAPISTEQRQELGKIFRNEP